ncbi:butyrophilin-like protein 10 isoform X2 [Octodon degus]|uniref:Butyrophilin-like protein 10 isoform X2 n=1 Tax=Octodon degus TaxID=10160 RepID=A0A6P6DTV9_OCTDE|nr:butyrophilin-like protein 10 isoform X2 [Octodon degus]
MARIGSGAASLPRSLVFLVFLKLLPLAIGKADFQVLGPQQPVLAVLGKDAELPCWLSPNISAHLMELRWFREQPSPAVHVHHAGQDKIGEQMPEYHNRTSFVDLDMAQGKAAVRIHRVTASDNGSYHCLFKEGRAQEAATLWLQVAGVGSKPRIQVIHTQDRGVWAECTSDGWYPQPEIKWKGQTLPNETKFSVSANTSLWAVVSRVALQDGAVDSFSCSISNTLLSEEKVANSHLPAPFSRGSQLRKQRLALAFSLLAMGLIMAGVIYLFGNCQRKAYRTQLTEETEGGRDEQSQQASMPRAMPLHETPRRTQ